MSDADIKRALEASRASYAEEMTFERVLETSIAEEADRSARESRAGYSAMQLRDCPSHMEHLVHSRRAWECVCSFYNILGGHRCRKCGHDRVMSLNEVGEIAHNDAVEVEGAIEVAKCLAALEAPMVPSERTKSGGTDDALARTLEMSRLSYTMSTPATPEILRDAAMIFSDRVERNLDGSNETILLSDEGHLSMLVGGTEVRIVNGCALASVVVSLLRSPGCSSLAMTYLARGLVLLGAGLFHRCAKITPTIGVVEALVAGRLSCAGAGEKTLPDMFGMHMGIRQVQTASARFGTAASSGDPRHEVPTVLVTRKGELAQVCEGGKRSATVAHSGGLW